VTARVSADEGRESLRVWLRLLSCANLIEGGIQARLRDRFDSSLARFDVLAQLEAAEREEAGGLTMTALSRRLMVTNGNVTALVQRLRDEGLVRRSVHDADRRSAIVRLTPAGRRALAAMVPAHREWIEALFGGLTAGERTQLHALVGKLKTGVERALAGEAP
jgi:DNA-binding MarR family transcriptional regulator